VIAGVLGLNSGKNRCCTDLDWSLKHPELVLASFNKNTANINDPDGLALIYNLHSSIPEFRLFSTSDVTSCQFSPFHSSLVLGGTYSGQVLVWDTRLGHYPGIRVTNI
jgi:dynein intermediate chain, cytosolic